MLSPLPDMRIHQLSTPVQQEAFTYWLAEQKSVAIDTETAGLAYWDKTRLVQIGTSSDVWVMAAEDAAEPIRQCVAGHKKLVMHNAPFDIPHLVRLLAQENPETVKRVMRNVDDITVRLIQTQTCKYFASHGMATKQLKRTNAEDQRNCLNVDS